MTTTLPTADDLRARAEAAARACGVDLEARAGEMEGRSPVNGGVVSRLAWSTAADVREVVNDAHVAYLAWRVVPAPARGALVRRWAALLALPAVLMPYLFLADMYFWMRNFGTNLDPTAPLSSAIEPFVPPIWGEGLVGQFRTIAEFQIGIYMAFLAGFLIIAGLYYHRRAYKPLVERQESAAQ